MIVSIVYLVFGLALTSMCINVVQVRVDNFVFFIEDFYLKSIDIKIL